MDKQEKERLIKIRKKYKPQCEDGRNGNCVTWFCGYCNQCIDNENRNTLKHRKR